MSATPDFLTYITESDTYVEALFEYDQFYYGNEAINIYFLNVIHILNLDKIFCNSAFFFICLIVSHS